MKKLTFGFMAFALAAATLFTSCNKDDDDDDDSSKTSILSATLSKTESFSTNKCAFYSTSSDTDASTSAFSGLTTLFNSGASTTIAGTANGKTLSLTYLGTGIESNGKTYTTSVESLKVKNSEATNIIIDLLSGKGLGEIAEDKATDLINKVTYQALVTYKDVDADAGSDNFYYSTEATITVEKYLALYITGTFSATLTNKSGDKIEITNGKFKAFGKGTL